MTSQAEGSPAQVEEQALQSLMEQIHKQVADYSSRLISDMNETCQSMEARQKKLNAQIDELSLALSSSRSDLEQERAGHQQQQQDNQKLVEQQQKQKQIAEKELQELNQLKQSHAEQTKQVEQGKVRITDLEARLASCAAERDELAAEHDSAAAQKQALEEQLSEAEGRAESFAIKVARYAESEQTHARQLDKASGESRTLKRQLEYAEERILQMQAEIENLQAGNNRLKTAHQQLTRDMEDTCNRAEEINSAFRRCKIELEKRDDELSALQQRLEQVLSGGKV